MSRDESGERTSTASDMRETVARAIEAYETGATMGRYFRGDHGGPTTKGRADAALAAATPIIRAALYDELIAEFEAGEDDGLLVMYTPDGMPVYSEVVSHHLRDRKEAEHGQ